MLIISVLNNHTFAISKQEEGINIFEQNLLDPNCLEQLRLLVEATDAKIILSSSWRRNKNTIEAVEKQLSKHGMKLSGMTTTEIYHDRQQAIKKWLDENEYDAYVALDDLPNVAEHQIIVDPLCGLQESDTQKAIEILNGEIND